MSGRKIGVLVVEDSESLIEILVAAIHDDADLELRGVARNGEEAVAAVARWKPDVITMDIMMPRLDGLSAIREIMASNPRPIVVVTSMAASSVNFQAISAGALDVVEKPKAVTTATGRASLAKIIETIKLMAEVKVVTRTRWRVETSQFSRCELQRSQPMPVRPLMQNLPRYIAVASSTGGPPALAQIFKNLPANFPIPILVVQHITKGFGVGLVEWMDSMLTLRVETAQYGVIPQPATIYVAPDDQHLLLGSNGCLVLSNAQPIHSHRPSADLLFESVGKYAGRDALAITLTGMGEDGVEGLRVLKQYGGTCIAQDEASCIVFGMPKAAIEAGLANRVLNLQQIDGYLQELSSAEVRSEAELSPPL